MSLDSEQLKQHCEEILKFRRIRNRIVVLCEGDVLSHQGTLSPQAYKQMEKMPDSNFYRASIPKWWKQFLPQFFNCGDRNDVLNTYFTLQELHNAGVESYLNPTKLFALVDLDLQLKKLVPSYPFPDTEAIFCNLYHKTKVNAANVSQHRIWVTGLIHKEAYFLVPGLQTVFDQSPVTAIYNGNALSLEDVYLVIANGIINDADLKNNFPIACNRINHCLGLDLTELTKLGNSWKTEFQSAQDAARKNELIFTLLTIRKAKDCWNRIEPSSDWSSSKLIFKDQLMLSIGRFYSEQVDTAQYHIPEFFKTLYQFV